MNRFFKSTEQVYEAIRAAMDAESGYPSAEAVTWFSPASEAIRDGDGLCLIAAMPEIAERFDSAGATEITEEEYQSSIPQPPPK